MGCSINSTKRKINLEAKKLEHINDIIVQPGLFIQQNSSKFQEIYRLGAILSSGNYSEVRSCYHKTTDEFRAVKILKKHLFKGDLQASLLSEVAILRNLDHPNIIRMYEFFEDEKRFFIVMEYCPGGDLFTEILNEKNFNEQIAVRIIQQVFSALAYLHSKGIVHRDLKPENILIDGKKENFNIKVIDFGLAAFVDGKNLKGQVGTIYYMAPEVILGEYDCKADVWSAGAILYVLLSGVPPFGGSTSEIITSKIISGEVPFPPSCWKHVSRPAIDFLSKLLCPAPARYSSQEALSNLWTTPNDSPPSKNSDSILQVLRNLQSFHINNKLQEAVRTFITSQLVSIKETRILTEVFKTIDKNGDGKLSVDELIEMYSQTMGLEEARTEAEKIMKEVDSDNNGFIDYSEFLRVSLDSKKILSTQNLQKAFQMFDKDGSGKISAKELKSVLNGGKQSDEGIWNELVGAVDLDGDGEIDLNEFQELILAKI
jgi:calcium-dependent protein kinase